MAKVDRGQAVRFRLAGQRLSERAPVGELRVIGALAGAMTAARGSARPACWSPPGTLCGLVFLLFPLTGPGWALAFYTIPGFVTSWTIIVLTVLSVSFQQAVTPEPMLGRMNATIRFLLFGAPPLGSLLGGVLAETVGMRTTLWTAGAGVLAAAGRLIFSPLRDLRDLPEACEPATLGSPLA